MVDTFLQPWPPKSVSWSTYTRVWLIPIYRYWLGEYSNRYRYPQNPPYRTDTDTGFIPILIQIYDTDITLKNRYETDIPIPISPISISSIPNRYRYPPYPPYRYRFLDFVSYRYRYRCLLIHTDFFHTDTDTGYRYHTGYQSNPMNILNSFCLACVSFFDWWTIICSFVF